MALFGLFSKRNHRPPEIYHYEFPDEVRNQVLHILGDVFGTSSYYEANSISRKTFEHVHRILCREYGQFQLVNGNHRLEPLNDVVHFFLTTQSVEKALDVVMTTLNYLEDNVMEGWTMAGDNARRISVSEAIVELNARFKNAGMGYSYDQRTIIRIDSTYGHNYITQPTLALLQSSKFAGANEEYLKAHEHYKQGRNKECIAECLKAFESTMKIICKAKKWNYDEHKSTANALIKICFDNELVPSWSQNQFSSLQNLLVSGVPTIRNRTSGHGQGSVPQTVDDEIARYGLNLTGSSIILLVELSGIEKK